MSIWWTQCLLVAQTNINEGAGKQTESQVVLFFIFFQTLITCLWIIIDGSQVNGLKTEIHPSPSYFQSSGDRTHILFISSARSSSVHHGLLHTYKASFPKFSCTYLSHTLHTSCAHLAHILRTPCTHLAHVLHTPCTHLAHILSTPCTHLAHILRTSCTLLAHILCTPCTMYILQIHKYKVQSFY